ncbi:hypothetical protein [Acinetobacter seifertii]|uniref:hypothetical protein n=1 Tax=Acinetobacter seifertii TaxID=1530123 RepID=UPI0032B50867
MADKKAEALKIVEEGLKELESPKGSVTVGVQKLSRAANLLNEDEIVAALLHKAFDGRVFLSC